MEGMGFWYFFVLALEYCVLPVVLIGIGITIFYFYKRYGQFAWERKILAVATGIITGSLSIVKYIRTYITYISFGEMMSLLYTTPTILHSFQRLLIVLFSGYIAGKMARQNEIAYGMATGTGILLVSCIWLFIPGLSSPKLQSHIWQIALIFIVIIGSTTLGSYFALLQRKTKVNTIESASTF